MSKILTTSNSDNNLESKKYLIGVHTREVFFTEIITTIMSLDDNDKSYILLNFEKIANSKLSYTEKKNINVQKIQAEIGLRIFEVCATHQIYDSLSGDKISISEAVNYIRSLSINQINDIYNSSIQRISKSVPKLREILKQNISSWEDLPDLPNLVIKALSYGSVFSQFKDEHLMKMINLFLEKKDYQGDIFPITTDRYPKGDDIYMPSSVKESQGIRTSIDHYLNIVQISSSATLLLKHCVPVEFLQGLSEGLGIHGDFYSGPLDARILKLKSEKETGDIFELIFRYYLFSHLALDGNLKLSSFIFLNPQDIEEIVNHVQTLRDSDILNIGNTIMTSLMANSLLVDPEYKNLSGFFERWISDSLCREIFAIKKAYERPINVEESTWINSLFIINKANRIHSEVTEFNILLNSEAHSSNIEKLNSSYNTHIIGFEEHYKKYFKELPIDDLNGFIRNFFGYNNNHVYGSILSWMHICDWILQERNDISPQFIVDMFFRKVNQGSSSLDNRRISQFLYILGIQISNGKISRSIINENIPKKISDLLVAECFKLSNSFIVKQYKIANLDKIIETEIARDAGLKDKLGKSLN